MEAQELNFTGGFGVGRENWMSPEPFMRTMLSVIALGAAAWGHGANIDPAQLPPAASRAVDFAREVQPIFEARCWNCYGPKKAESAFRLDDRAEALKGGERGNDIIPGKSSESLLIHAVSGLHDE